MPIELGHDAACDVGLSVFGGPASLPDLTQFSKLSPELKSTFGQLAQANVDLKSLVGQLPAGVDPRTLLKQAGVDLNLDTMLAQAGLPSGAGEIASGALQISKQLFSGKADVGDIALEVTHTLKGVLSQIGGPLSQGSDVAAGVVTDALGIKGVGSDVGGTAGSTVGLIFGPAGSAVGNAIGQLVGGSVEKLVNAVGVGSKAARLEREQNRKRSDYAVIEAFVKKLGDAGAYRQFTAGQVALSFGVPGSQHESERSRVAVRKGRLTKISKEDFDAHISGRPNALALASNQGSKDFLDRMQRYEVQLFQKRQQIAKQLKQKIKDSAAQKLDARNKLKSGLQKAVAYHSRKTHRVLVPPTRVIARKAAPKPLNVNSIFGPSSLLLDIEKQYGGS